MIDTHCHLNDKSYDKDIATVIQSGIEAGMKYFIVPATCPKDLNKTLTIANQFDNVYCAVGVHPHDAVKVTPTVLSDIKKMTTEKKVVAIGEIGLDYYYNNSIPEQQIAVLRQQIEIAIESNKPVIIHNRESDNDMIQVLSDYKGHLQGVCHCFSSNEQMLEKLLSLGYYISFTANIIFSKINMDDVILQTPMERLMLETDSPYMTPPPDRGKRNVPQNVIKVAEKISKIKNISINEVINMTTTNAKALFRIPILTILLFLNLFLLNNNNLSAQYNPSNNQDDYYYDDEEEYEEDLPDPFNRKLGVGVLLGTNTFVDRYTTGQKSFSWDGLLSIGGLVNYRFHENFIAQVAYTYSKNTKAVDNMPDSLKNMIDPNHHRALEFSLVGMLTARNMVNFYASAGATYFMNKWSRNSGVKHYVNDNKVGINFGIGAFVNINMGTAGTLTFNAEWKLGFRLDDVVFSYDPRARPGTPAYDMETRYSSMSSVPRGGIIWYIPWLK